MLPAGSDSRLRSSSGADTGPPVAQPRRQAGRRMVLGLPSTLPPRASEGGRMLRRVLVTCTLALLVLALLAVVGPQLWRLWSTIRAPKVDHGRLGVD